ncbi:hypothetical protein SAMN05660733_00702 [Lentzea albidocapillata]|uniref:DUF2306 domain-containing protein n=2 Tax=Lentzea TaxID=165301 RepID=A0A1W2AI25_9PSEU|nr:hypothetical protein SAMN05660733_00702 [Lentzea albidocapillata]
MAMALQVLIVGHVLLGLMATITGAAAMLSPKRAGRHPRRGLFYLAGLTGVALTGSVIAMSDWTHLWHLATLGAAAAALAAMGFAARRTRWRGWLAWHIVGMGGSYIAMLTAFYVDNGPRLPLWQLLPPVTFWFLPAIVGLPLIAFSLRRYVRT